MRFCECGQPARDGSNTCGKQPCDRGELAEHWDELQDDSESVGGLDDAIDHSNTRD